jgi:hypothetical protein
MPKLRTLFLCAGLAILLAADSATAFAGQKFLLTMDGTKQGKLKGESKVQGHEGWTEAGKVTIGEFDMNGDQQSLMRALRDPRRKHAPIKIVREVDTSSPKLFQALVTNEVFTTAKIDFIEVPPGANAKPKVIHHMLIKGGEYSIKRLDKGMVELVILPHEIEYQ